MHILPRTGMDNALVEYAGNKLQPSAFYKELRQLALDLEVKLIVIDTAADTFCGNENDRQHVRYYIQLLNGLAHDIGGAILLCAHPSVYGLTSGSGAGGSTAWSNTVRSRLYLERQKPDNEAAPDDNIRILSRKKANYAGINENITLYWENGVFNVKPVAGKDTVDWIKERVCMKDFLAAMRKLADEGITLSVSKNSPSYAPKIVSNKIGKKYKYAEIDKAMSKLLDAGNIKNEAYGAPSKSLHRLVIVKEMES
jgi:RecA-family ATPase